MVSEMTPIRWSEAMMVDLVTFKRDGTPVHTPVLSTPTERGLLIRTHHTAGKLKRLRNRSDVEVTPCDGRGRLQGSCERGRARVLPEAETAVCLGLLHRHHGLVGRVATWLRHLRGMRDVFIDVDLVGAARG
jgi:uncharacterized protein